MFKTQAFILLLSFSFIFSWKLKVRPFSSIVVENPFYFPLSEICTFKYKLSPQIGKASISSPNESFSIDNQELTTFEVPKASLRKNYQVRLQVDSKVSINNNSDSDFVIKCALENAQVTLLSDLKVLSSLSQENDPNISYDFVFQPNVPEKFSNPLFFAVSATCSLKTEGSQEGFGKVLKGKAKLNGVEVPKDGLTLVLTNGEVLKLWASAFSEVQIENKGTQTINANCELGSEEIKRKVEEIGELLELIEGHESSFVN